MSGQVVRLKKDWTSIHEAATTVSLAFANDPLIRWIRPGAHSWAKLDAESLRFQHRRIQRMNEEFMVLRLGQGEILGDHRKLIKSANMNVTERLAAEANSDDYGAIAMLEPPQQKGMNLRSVYARMKYWLKDRIDPCEDPGGNINRLVIMMEAHELGLEELRRQLYPRNPWYIEVIAVRPSSHGQGLGGRMMRGIIDMVGNAPIILECTDKATIGYYRKYGFAEVKEMILRDPAKPEDDMRCFWMVRE